MSAVRCKNPTGDRRTPALAAARVSPCRAHAQRRARGARAVPADAVAVRAGSDGGQLAEDTKDLLVAHLLGRVQVRALDGRVGLGVEGRHGCNGAHDHAHWVCVVAERLEVLRQVLVDERVPQHPRLPVLQLRLQSCRRGSQQCARRVGACSPNVPSRRPCVARAHLVGQLAVDEQERHLEKARLFDQLFNVVPAVPVPRGSVEPRPHPHADGGGRTEATTKGVSRGPRWPHAPCRGPPARRSSDAGTARTGGCRGRCR